LWRGDVERAFAFDERALAAALRAGSDYDVTHALSAIAIAQSELGNPAAARTAMEECLALDRRIGDRLGICADTYLLGCFAIDGHDLRAEALLSEARELAVELDSTHFLQTTTDMLGWLALRQGQRGLARNRFAESLALARRANDQVGTANSVHGLAILAAQTDPEQGARLIGVLDALNVTMGGEVMPSDRPEYEAAIAAATAALGPEAYAVAYESGRNRPLDEAITEALAYAQTAGSDPGAG
jgi:tetratricopeptide (TPR) repeat protein